MLGASLKVANAPNTSPMNSATSAPALRAARRSAVTRVLTACAASADRTIGTVTMQVSNQSMAAMMAIAPTAKPTTPTPSIASSSGRQPSSTSSRTRLTVSLELRGVARAAGPAAIRRSRLSRTSPVARVHRPPHNHSAPTPTSARVTPIAASSARIDHGVMASGASPASPS